LTPLIKYLTADAIEERALKLLRSYFKQADRPIEAPIPVEEILEFHLGFSLDFENLHSMLGKADVLGATWLEQQAVYIDESLDPVEHPNMAGRYKFTIGHEIGHIDLHRKQLATQGVPQVAFRHYGLTPLLVCLLGQRKERIEWQADQYSAALLMPQELVLHAWNQRFQTAGSRPYIFERKHWFDLEHKLDKPRMRPIGQIIQNTLEPRPKSVANVFRQVGAYFAPQFGVSTQAMQIRLESLGLLQCPGYEIRMSSN
jgi:Zn-dependent peptidase ImmA (M78 family)